PRDDGDFQIIRHAQDFIVRVNDDLHGLTVRLKIKIFALALYVDAGGLAIAFASEHQFYRHAKVIEVLLDCSARAKFSGAGAYDLILDGELRHSSTFDPLREEVAHAFACDLA